MDHLAGENISDSPIYATASKITLVTIVIVFTIVMLMSLSYLFDRWHHSRSRSHHIRNNLHTMVFFPTHTSHTAASRGLDPSVVESLHVFTFSNETHKDQTDCAVCLSEFEEGESGRVLPGCKHAFHVECIDMWFHSHSTCPLCRSLVELPATTVEEQVEIITVSSATEPGGDAAGVEVPTRNYSEFEDDSPPMSRVLSLTRMLSRNGRSAPSSLAGAPPSSSCRVVMTESDIERGGGEEIK